MYKYLLETLAFNSFTYILRSSPARSYSNSIFNFLRNCHTVFHMTIPFYIPINGGYNFSTSSPTFVIFCFLNSSHLMCISLLLSLICITLMISDIANLFIVLNSHLCIIFEKCLLKSFAHFLIWLGFFVVEF